MGKKSTAKSIARALEKNERYSQYINSMIRRESIPVQPDEKTLKESEENNRAFFNEIKHLILGK